MAELTGKERERLRDSAFALPGRRYPIHDEAHARNALARVAQFGSPEEKARVRAAVRRRYPHLGKESRRGSGRGPAYDSGMRGEE